MLRPPASELRPVTPHGTSTYPEVPKKFTTTAGATPACCVAHAKTVQRCPCTAARRRRCNATWRLPRIAAWCCPRTGASHRPCMATRRRPCIVAWLPMHGKCLQASGPIVVPCVQACHSAHSWAVSTMSSVKALSRVIAGTRRRPRKHSDHSKKTKKWCEQCGYAKSRAAGMSVPRGAQYVWPRLLRQG
eukprot:366544-Chlamydomonas_euryale.AAC.6